MVEFSATVLIGGAILAGVVIIVIASMRNSARPVPRVADDRSAAASSGDGDIEQVVGRKSELKNGEMKECSIDGQQILLVRDNERVFAIGSKCTHIGANLKDGVVANGHVRCPIHGACFNLHTGDIEEYPCSDALPRFDLRVGSDGDELTLCATRAQLAQKKRAPDVTPIDAANKTVTVIVGAGAAGGTAAEALRQNGYTGRIVMIGAEPHLPYDRTKLSKALSSDGARLQWRTNEFYSKLGVEVCVNTTVVSFDAVGKRLTMRAANDDATTTLAFNYALLATGGTPRSLPCAGFGLKRVYQLRTPVDANAINAAVTSSTRVVIIGSSFIGMEAASALAKKAASIDVIGMETVPFERVLGVRLGEAMQKLHESNGIRFHLQRVVKSISDDGQGGVSEVVLDNDVRLKADVCVVGAGVVPTTSFITGLTLAKDGSVQCDETMRACDGVYAAGDIARFTYPLTGDSIRVEHYAFAMQQGCVAAANIAGKRTAVLSVPFFWTTVFGKTLRYAGHAIGYDEVVIDGQPEAMSFIAVYARKGIVLAAAGIGRDQQMAAAAELLAMRKMPPVTAWAASGGHVDLVAQLHK